MLSAFRGRKRSRRREGMRYPNEAVSRIEDGEGVLKEGGGWAWWMAFVSIRVSCTVE